MVPPAGRTFSEYHPGLALNRVKRGDRTSTSGRSDGCGSRDRPAGRGRFNGGWRRGSQQTVHGRLQALKHFEMFPRIFSSTWTSPTSRVDLSNKLKQERCRPRKPPNATPGRSAPQRRCRARARAPAPAHSTSGVVSVAPAHSASGVVSVARPLQAGHSSERGRNCRIEFTTCNFTFQVGWLRRPIRINFSYSYTFRCTYFALTCCTCLRISRISFRAFRFVRFEIGSCSF